MSYNYVVVSPDFKERYGVFWSFSEAQEFVFDQGLTEFRIVKTFRDDSYPTWLVACFTVASIGGYYYFFT